MSDKFDAYTTLDGRVMHKRRRQPTTTAIIGSSGPCKCSTCRSPDAKLARCRTCDREMIPNDPRHPERATYPGLDCGGDCLACVRAAETAL